MADMHPAEPACNSTFDVAIAGAGVAGLGCAAWLAERGLRVIVCESQPVAGGRAASWEDASTSLRVDIGPHVITSEHRNFLALLERLGTQTQIDWQADPLITLLDAGRTLRMHAPHWPPPLHGLPNLPNALRCVSLRDLLSNTRLAWAAARMCPAELMRLDRTDALHYLRSMGVSERFIDWFWTPAMLALLNVPLANCSAFAVMRVFALMLGRSGYGFGFPRTGLSDLFVPGCRALIEAQGGRVLHDTAVLGVRSRRQHFAGFTLSAGRTLWARAGVLALPPQAVLEVGQQDPVLASACSAEALRRFRPCPYVSTMLWFDRKLTRERFWARVYRQGDLNTDFYDLSNIRPDLASGPSVIAANAIHAVDSDALGDACLVERTRAEIAEFASGASSARVVHSRVHRIPMAVPCASPGVEAHRPSNATAMPGLWLAGDWTDTGLPFSMESAARSGALAAEAIGQALGQPLAAAIAPPRKTGIVAWLERGRGKTRALPH